MRWPSTLGALAVLLLAAAGAEAAGLPKVKDARPGPALLYKKAPSTPPQLQNTGVWSAPPILVSGATAYRRGEFIYQDFLYDDHGAAADRDPADPRFPGNVFSQPNGTYTYPTAASYANNAADLVELRVKRVAGATAFRVTLNTMKDPSLAAFSIAIGNSAVPRPFPKGANVSAPAAMFLTVFPSASGMTAQLTNAATGTAVPGGAPAASVDRTRRQVEVRVPHGAWNPSGSVRLAAGVGLWDKANGRYLVPGPTATAGRPGGGGVLPNQAAFFNVAFRTAEPIADVGDAFNTARRPASWRDSQQGEQLAARDISPIHANVDFGKLAAGTNDDAGVPKNGPINRILASRFDNGQGADWADTCFPGNQRTCLGPIRGRLQPYAIYVPRKPMPRRGYGMTLLMHSLSTNYNQYSGSRNQSQFGERGAGSIVITPESRGPDGFYTSYAGAEVFEVWADVARRYRLDPDWAVSTGYSMGGIGTFKLAEQFPDLFARAQPTVGSSDDEDMIASLRNVPVLMWNASSDELVPPTSYLPTAQKLDSLGYRYELDVFTPGEHNLLAINDQFAPAAAFLGSARVNRNPHHVTYVVNTALDHPKLGFVADHAYWLSKLRLSRRPAEGDPKGTIDAFSHGFGLGRPKPTATRRGAGTLTGGRLGTFAYTSQSKAWGRTPRIRRANRLDLRVRNLSRATINVRRARLRCNARVNVDTDVPITLRFARCRRVVRLGCVNSRRGVRGNRLGPARLGRTRRRQRRAFRGKALRTRRGMDRYCARGGGSFRIGYPTRRLSRGQRRAARRRAVLVLTSSKRFKVGRSRRGTRVRTLRRRLRGERRMRVGRNVWYLARARRTTLVFKTRRGRVREVGIANRRITRGNRDARRFLRAWQL